MVATRSQVNVIQERNEMRDEQDNPNLGNRHQLRNPHHGLKEKMKALTQLYEQQKQSSISLRNPSPKPDKVRFSTHPSVDLLSSGSCKQESEKRKLSVVENQVMRENSMPVSTVSKTYILPQQPPPQPIAAVAEDAKENIAVAVDGGGGGGNAEKIVVMRENSMPASMVSRTYILPQQPPPQPPAAAEDARDKVAAAVGGGGGNGEKIVGFTCPPRRGVVTTNVVRKLSMGGGGGGYAAAGGGGEGVVKNAAESEGVTVKLGSVGSRILVFVRLRPLSKKEKEVGSRSCVRIVNQKEVYLTEFANENDYLRLKRLRGRHFTFDAAFPDSSSQLDVYSTSTSELVEAVLQGRNGSVFCYGATGAGKTFTMLGTVENPGVMVLAIKDLFNKVRKRSCDGNHVVHLSYLEVYNETVRDLLSPGRPLILREDKQGIVAAGLTQYRAYSTDEVMMLLQQGNRNRTTEPTRANETSSRSHAILQVMVEYRVKDECNNIINRVGKLSLIDLAGSERAHATDQRTLRSLEGANINRSLLALSSCINALVEGKKHVPYRNSKLTQLLKDSLGGPCNTVMIANISPSNLSFGETQNTLHWADRAKEIRTKAYEANEEITKIPNAETDQAKLLLELQKENHDLRAQLARQQQKLLMVQAQSLAAASPTPSTISSILTTPPTSCRQKERKPKSFLPRNCFTPESKKKAPEETVKELKQTIKMLEAAMEKMKKDHGLQMKQKDDLIREISQKGGKRVVTKGNLRPKETETGELKSPSSRFMSPAVRDKKRSFWDITTANSPSVVTLNGRKTRSHVVKELAAAPSMLLQPGFARQKP
ncbi:putative plus-end-directed kinesin ATPase [Helianthus annuus]|uniref:Kinesin-like protein n=1 Tax=Helianthus annuus TaxID=4232 RepID=A0A251VHH7_HELAN|nr:kinesin-like protein KIN-8A [Helianthus annuus]KAF5818072.1 putative plus-end-directed kinesin ATPase [Helianthus annuus]KAJ0604433.1 putative plus-end-directed kinesin ATPase [Helianthus annuus]